jgi:arylsulfatase A-like enzyme
MTPHIDRLAARSAVFEGHWSGSLPCMPARRDILTGRTAFLERGWGSIEPFDRTLPAALRVEGIFSHIVTDHYHYFATGGENYCQSFDTWDFHRGQEHDPWRSIAGRRETEPPHYGRFSAQRELNVASMTAETDYPGPRTMAAACDWLEKNKDEDEFFLMVEAFDPHEPFDAMPEDLALYGDDYDGPRYDWPHYGDSEAPDEAERHLRRRYAANLTMIDRALGKLLDTMDRHDMWKDTLVIFTTDHGFLLGEHRQLGKNVMHVYNELAHLPLMVSLPGQECAGRRIKALTQNIDLMPTILDYMGAAIPATVKGYSLLPLLRGSIRQVRKAALFGYHGMAVNVTDGRYVYMRAPANEDNSPCFAYTAMPTTFRAYLDAEDRMNLETGRFLSYTHYPVYRFPESVPGSPYARNRNVLQSRLFELERDYGQQHPILDEELEQTMIAKLRQSMAEADSPSEQYVRLGLT